MLQEVHIHFCLWIITFQNCVSYGRLSHISYSRNKALLPTASFCTGHVTLLKEYCQGPNKMMYVLPTGGFDPRKHKDKLDCAKAELLEEVHIFLLLRPQPVPWFIRGRINTAGPTDWNHEDEWWLHSGNSNVFVICQEIIISCGKDILTLRTIIPTRAWYLQAGLSGGEWHQLIPSDHPGIAEVKWCANRFTPFLCINPWVSLSASCSCRVLVATRADHERAKMSNHWKDCNGRSNVKFKTIQISISFDHLVRRFTPIELQEDAILVIFSRIMAHDRSQYILSTPVASMSHTKEMEE